MTRGRKLAVVGVAVVVAAGVVAWVRSGPPAPRPATFAPGRGVMVEDSEMSPKAFKERRRQLVESHRAGAGEAK
jgi:hypothetical protein